jgi:hypothetical protein
MRHLQSCRLSFGRTAVVGALLVAAASVVLSCGVSGSEHCRGSMPLCYLRSQMECIPSSGCRWGPACGEHCLVTQSPCTPGVIDNGLCDVADEEACVADTTCSWGTYCSGTPVHCATFGSASECSIHEGCWWEETPAL